MSALHAEPLADHVVDVLGVRFHRVTSAQVVEQMLHWIAEKTRRMVITAGPEFVIQAQVQPQILRISRSADIVTADGIGIVWAAARCGRPVPERVTGVELVTDLLAQAQRRHQSLRVFLLGATDKALTACIQRFQIDYPQFVFAGRNGFFTGDEVESVLEEIRVFQPDLWLVGIGQPRQEQFIYDSLAKIPPCVAVGVGGSIDVWGGTVTRAPELFRRLNIEWLYRLLRQPSRWRRQLALPRFAWKIIRDKAGSR